MRGLGRAGGREGQLCVYIYIYIYIYNIIYMCVSYN